MQVIPRIRGNVMKSGSRWIYELFITIGPTEPIVMRFDNEIYMSELAARNALRVSAADVMKEVCKAIGLGTPAELMDLNAGVTQPIDEFIKPAQPKGQ